MARTPLARVVVRFVVQLVVQQIHNKVSPRGAARRYASRRRQFGPKIAADLRPSADGSAVRTSLLAGGG